MWKQSVWTSTISSHLAALHLKEGGLLTLAGAKAALSGTGGEPPRRACVRVFPRLDDPKGRRRHAWARGRLGDTVESLLCRCLCWPTSQIK